MTLGGFIGVLVIGLIVGLLARFITPGPNPRGIIVTIVIGIVGAVIATYGGQALGLYEAGQPAGFIGSGLGAVVLLGLLRLFGRLKRQHWRISPTFCWPARGPLFLPR